MASFEEVVLKLKLDQSQVDPGLNSFKGKVSEATGHAHKSFLHATSGPKAFHKLIHQISESSPVMGGAIQAALNPIGGAILAGAAAFAWLNKQIEEGEKRMDMFGSTAHMKLGDTKTAAHDAAKAVEALGEKFDELNKKEARERQAQSNADQFDRNLKNDASRARRAESVMGHYKDQALGKVDADEKAGRITPEQASARREMIGSDASMTERQMQIAAEQRVRDAHLKEKKSLETLAGASDKVLGEVEGDASGKTASGAKRQRSIKRSAAEIPAMKAHLDQLDKAMEEAKKFQDDTEHVKIDWSTTTWGGALHNAAGAVANTMGWTKEQMTGMTGDEMVDAIQAQKAQYERALQKAEKINERDTKAQKEAESKAALARDENSKLHTDIRTHGIAAEDSQRKLDEMGKVKSYSSLQTLAKGGNKEAQRLLQLQGRFAGEDPNSIEGRRDSMAIQNLQGSLAAQGLQPSEKEKQSALETAVGQDGSVRVRIVNAQ